MSGGDVLLRGGEVLDGTGAPAVRADVRVRGGRIVEVDADLWPEGEPVVDASGAFVAPGFIASHAHTDPQVFWDPTLDPEPQHGVTTMLIGNCSLSLHPVNESTRDVADLFAYVESLATCSTSTCRGPGATTPATATRWTTEARARTSPRWWGTARSGWP